MKIGILFLRVKQNIYAPSYAALNEGDWVIYDCQRQSNKCNSAKEPSCCGEIETTNETFAGAGLLRGDRNHKRDVCGSGVVIYDCQRQSNKCNSAKEPSCCGKINHKRDACGSGGIKPQTGRLR